MSYKAVVKWLSIPGGREPPKRTVVCRTTDVSGHGTRLTLLGQEKVKKGGLTRLTHLNVPVGSVARIRVTFKSPHKSFVHIGTVRWVNNEPGSSAFVIGFELTGSPPKTMESWEEFIESNIEQSDGHTS